MKNRTQAEIAYDATRLSPVPELLDDQPTPAMIVPLLEQIEAHFDKQAPVMPANPSPLLLDLVRWAHEHSGPVMVEHEEGWDEYTVGEVEFVHDYAQGGPRGAFTLYIHSVNIEEVITYDLLTGLIRDLTHLVNDARVQKVLGAPSEEQDIAAVLGQVEARYTAPLNG